MSVFRKPPIHPYIKNGQERTEDEGYARQKEVRGFMFPSNDEPNKNATEMNDPRA
jgi:hypothetical protein